jgi:hypothetical protein
MELHLYWQERQKICHHYSLSSWSQSKYGDATAFQQQYRTQYADETARVEINPHKQMMIDLEYFMEELKTDGFEVVVFIDANETLDHRVRSQNHDHK